jgi:hypothetical protein
VPADGGGFAIGVTRREWGLRLARLDLRAGTVARWHDARYAAWADTTDGDLWFVGEDDALVAVDPLAPDARALWRVATKVGPVSQVARGEKHVTALIGGAERERWVHALPGMRLTQRKETSPATDALEHVSPDGTLHVVSPPRTGHLMWRKDTDSLMLPMPERQGATPTLARVHGNVHAVALSDGAVLAWEGARCVVELDLAGARVRALRLTAEDLLVGDDRGRAIVVSLTAGAVVRDLRVG